MASVAYGKAVTRVTGSGTGGGFARVPDCDRQLKTPSGSLDEDDHLLVDVLIESRVERVSVDLDKNISLFQLTVCGSSWQNAMNHNKIPPVSIVTRLKREESLDVASLTS
ncbi:uncharacterized protein FFNC_15353 [Fusarium fujikuroi]|nr:uncharacterized protein FFNC_15353 [Fusarium fujikuroi]